MRVVIQRVSFAEVKIDGDITGSINNGLLILLGVMQGDSRAEAEKLSKKICELRIFEDDAGKMNKSLLDINGEALVVSQFTLAADCSHGRRPSFITAETPSKAVSLYEYFVDCMSNILDKEIPTGKFGADMKVSLLNDGPVTIILDTDNLGG